MKPVILIDGWGATEGLWCQVQEKINGRFPCSFFSWRHGVSGEAIWRHPLRADSDRAVLVGWSLGGLLALQAARSFPARIAGLILISATPRMAAEGAYPGVSEKVLRAMILKLRCDRGAVLREFAANALHPEKALPWAEEFLAMAETFSTQELVQGLEYLARVDLRGFLEKMAFPSRILHGSDDRIIPPDQASYLHRRLAGSVLTLIPGAGHLLPWSCPEKILREIESLSDDRQTD